MKHLPANPAHNFRPVSSVYGKILKMLMAYSLTDDESLDDTTYKFGGIKYAFQDVEFVIYGNFMDGGHRKLKSALLNSVPRNNAHSSIFGKPVKPPINSLFKGKTNVYVNNHFKLKEFLKTDSKELQVKMLLEHLDMFGKELDLINEQEYANGHLKLTYLKNHFKSLTEEYEDLKGNFGIYFKDNPNPITFIQDPFVVLQNEKQSALLEPYYYRSFSFQFVAEQVSEQLNIPVYNFKYYLDGGNILASDHCALIGKDLLNSSYKLEYPDKPDLNDMDLLWKELLDAALIGDCPDEADWDLLYEFWVDLLEASHSSTNPYRIDLYSYLAWKDIVAVNGSLPSEDLGRDVIWAELIQEIRGQNKVGAKSFLPLEGVLKKEITNVERDGINQYIAWGNSTCSWGEIFEEILKKKANAQIRPSKRITWNDLISMVNKIENNKLNFSIKLFLLWEEFLINNKVTKENSHIYLIGKWARLLSPVPINSNEEFVLFQPAVLKKIFTLWKGMPKQQFIGQKKTTGEKPKNSKPKGNPYYKLNKVREVADYYAVKFQMKLDNIFWVGLDKMLRPGESVLPLISDEPTFQPLFHIDLFLTLGGKTNDGEKDVVFLSKVFNYSKINLKEEQLIYAKTLNEQLDEISNNLLRIKNNETGKLRFKIIRIPIIIENIGRKIPSLKSYNNCIVEIYENKSNGEISSLIKNVYIPKYQRSALSGKNNNRINIYKPAQDKTISKFEKNGFSVIKVEGPFANWAERNGSLNCLTKVLLRESYQK